jgi:hypothetical protein
LTRLVETLTEKPSSPALLKKLTDLEEQETSLLSQLAQLKDHTAAPIVVPTIEQSRERSIRIQQDLRSKDPATARQTLLGIIDSVKADRIGKHVIAKLDLYHVPKKQDDVYYVYNASPRGGTSYRHSISLEGIIPNSGRPNKKPIN